MAKSRTNNSIADIQKFVAAGHSQSAANCRVLLDEIVRLRTVATDRLYMLAAVEALLGPVARRVVARWREQGIRRIHHTFGPGAEHLPGEELAQAILDFEDATRTRMIDDVDKGTWRPIDREAMGG